MTKRIVTFAGLVCAVGFGVVVLTGGHLEPLGWCLAGISIGVAALGLIFP